MSPGRIDSFGSYLSAFQDRKGGTPAGQRADEPMARVMDALADGPKTVSDLVAGFGLDLSVLMEALDRMEKYGVVALTSPDQDGERIVRLTPAGQKVRSAAGRGESR
jgi:DNA-binding MarR family transcriptional regulator